MLNHPKHLSFRGLWQTPLCCVDQGASHCNQLLIFNEDWCLEGWPCVRFLSGMDAYWSPLLYALLGTRSPPLLIFFLVHITDSTFDDQWHWFRPKQAREDECDGEGNVRKLGRFEFGQSCCPLLNTKRSISVSSYSLRKWNSDLCNQTEIPVIAPGGWAANKDAWEGQWPHLRTNTGDMASSSEPIS